MLPATRRTYHFNAKCDISVNILSMEILIGLELEDELIEQLISSGRSGHEVAQAHHNDPGSNGFTFGNDRYHRSCELARIPLEKYGFNIKRMGAALHALRGTIELHFATARTSNVEIPASFDTNTDSRVAAAQSNAMIQLSLEGIEEALPRRQIFHWVWSGNEASGLIAVHVGRLVANSDHGVVWDVVRRIDGIELDLNATHDVPPVVSPNYADQEEPILKLSVIESSDIAGDRTHDDTK